MEKLQIKDKKFKLWRSFSETWAIIIKARKKELNQYGISVQQAVVIDCIYLSGTNNVTPTEISKWLILQPQSISGLLNRMIKNGLIIKTRDTERRNVKRVSLTEKGKQIYPSILKRKSINSIIMSINKEERKQLESILTKMQTASHKQLRKDKI